VRKFTQQARVAEIAIVYYAGHGIEVEGENWLIPVDALNIELLKGGAIARIPPSARALHPRTAEHQPRTESQQ